MATFLRKYRKYRIFGCVMTQDEAGRMPQRTKREKEPKSAGFNLQKNDKEANRRLALNYGQPFANPHNVRVAD